jgi:hypothetical protein
MQVEGTKSVKLYKGSIDAGLKIYKWHGFRGLQKGATACLARDFLFFGLFFYFYEVISQHMAGIAQSDPH